jgi:hypothetical protein
VAAAVLNGREIAGAGEAGRGKRRIKKIGKCTREKFEGLMGGQIVKLKIDERGCGSGQRRIARGIRSDHSVSDGGGDDGGEAWVWEGESGDSARVAIGKETTVVEGSQYMTTTGP